MRSTATTVEQYLAELPPERRDSIARVRDVILKHLPAGFTEGMAFGMIGYAIPLERYTSTYNKQPLAYAALAAQKNYNALYLMSVYQGRWAETVLRKAFAAAGLKLDMGKSCIRFQRPEDLPLAAIGELIGSGSVEEHIAAYESGRSGRA
jgi:hypothetical protein